MTGLRNPWTTESGAPGGLPVALALVFGLGPSLGWARLPFVIVAALLVLVGAPLVAGLSQWWTLLAVGVGIAAVLAEVATLFSGGIVGVSRKGQLAPISVAACR